MDGNDYTPAQVGELEPYAVDYSTCDALAAGETIASAVWIVPTGLTAVGDPVISGTRVSQRLRLDAPGSYYPRCKATTSLGNVLILPDAGAGLLRVVQ